MLAPRRLSFQLTSLLDLLLIVIFAQYLEVRLNAESARAKAAQTIADLDRRQADMETQWSERIQAQQATLSEQQAELDARRSDVARQLERFVRVLSDQLRLDQLAERELAALQQAAISEASTQPNQLSPPLANALRQIASRGPQLSELLTKFDLLKKHTSLWELHLKDNGQAWLTDGQSTRQIGFESTSEFQSRVFQATKSLPQPKALVLIVLSYADTQARYRRIAEDAMPALTETLRSDSSNTRWYEYSLLGYRPDGPMIVSP